MHKLFPLFFVPLAFLHGATTQESRKDSPPPAKEAEWVTFDDAGIKVLAGYLKEEKRDIVLLMALDTLARMGAQAKPAVPAIVETLRRTEGRVRIEAARTLIDLNAETELALRTLKEAVKAKDPSIQALAIRLIGELSNPPPEGTSCWAPGPRPATPRPEIGKQAVPALTEALKSNSMDVRRSAAYSLGLIGSNARAAVPPLIEALADREASIRAEAGRALASMGPTGRDAIPMLVRALKDPERDVSLAAAHALRHLDPDLFVKSAVPFLVEIVRDKDSDHRVRQKAVYALEDLGSQAKKVVPALCELLGDKDSFVRWAAASCLGFGPEAKAAIPPLIGALRDSDANVRGMAAYALGNIGPEAGAAVPVLVTALRDDDGRVQSRAAFALGGIGRKAEGAVPALTQALKAKDEQTAAGAAFALGRIGVQTDVVVPALVAALGHTKWEVRAQAASALGEFGDRARSAIPSLIERLKNDDWLVLEQAANALRRMGSQAVKAAVSSLIEALNNKNQNVRRNAAFSLGLIDADAKSVSALIRMLREDSSARYAAARALGMMGPKARSAIPALLESSKDQDDAVRAEAAAALKKVGQETGGKIPQR